MKEKYKVEVSEFSVSNIWCCPQCKKSLTGKDKGWSINVNYNPTKPKKSILMDESNIIMCNYCFQEIKDCLLKSKVIIKLLKDNN